MKKYKAVVIEYNKGVETGHRKYKSVEKAWMDAERKNTTDPLCIQKLRYCQVVQLKRTKDSMNFID